MKCRYNKRLISNRKPILLKVLCDVAIVSANFLISGRQYSVIRICLLHTICRAVYCAMLCHVSVAVRFLVATGVVVFEDKPSVGCCVHDGQSYIFFAAFL